MAAQLAPAFGVCVSDFDDDEVVDQNLSAVPCKDPDGLRHQLVGAQAPVLAGWCRYRRASGVRFTVNNAIATSDFDQDGRADLVITQNGYETRLRSIGIEVGPTVRVMGLPGNGTRVDCPSPGLSGPPGPRARDPCGRWIWSQDSAVQVLGKDHQDPERVIDPLAQSPHDGVCLACGRRDPRQSRRSH